jgi:hypothetical protein
MLTLSIAVMELFGDLGNDPPAGALHWRSAFFLDIFRAGHLHIQFESLADASGSNSRCRKRELAKTQMKGIGQKAALDQARLYRQNGTEFISTIPSASLWRILSALRPACIPQIRALTRIVSSSDHVPMDPAHDACHGIVSARMNCL